MHKNIGENELMIPAIRTRYAATMFAAYSFLAAGIFFILLMFFGAMDGSEDGAAYDIISNVIAALILLCLVFVVFSIITSITMAITVTKKRNAFIAEDKIKRDIFKAGRVINLSALKGWDKFRMNFMIKLVIALILPVILCVVAMLLFSDAEGCFAFAFIGFATLFGWGLISCMGDLHRQREESLYRQGTGLSFWNMSKADENVFEMLRSERAVIISMGKWERGVEDFAANLCKETASDPSAISNTAYFFNGSELNRHFGRAIVDVESAEDIHLVAVPVISCTGGQRQFLVSQKAANNVNNCLLTAGGIGYTRLTQVM